MKRRTFLAVGASAAGVVVLGTSGCRPGAAPASLVPGPFLVIDGNGLVTVTVARAEMGQGARTALAMLVAEELDADWNTVSVRQGDLDPKYGEQFAGGSAVIRTSWTPLRQAGATARAMLIAAAAARWGVPSATCEARAGRVVHAGSGRSAGYGELVAAAARLPVPADVPLKQASEFRIIGTPRPNLDHPDIVTGRMKFGSDVRVEGMLFAVIARAPAFGGAVRGVNDQAARAVPGVRVVIVVDADKVPFFGDNNPRMANGVAVLADSTWAALRGRKALQVDWDDRGGRTESTERMRQEAERLAGQPDRYGTDRGAPFGPAFRAAALRLEAVYHTPLLAHAQMEPMNCVADVRDDRCEVWAPTQMPEYVRVAAERITGLPPEAITVHVPRMGGAFGRRFYADYAAEAIYLSRAARSPVQVVWTREDDLGHGFYRPAGYHVMRAGLNASGGLAAWEHRLFNASRGHYLQWAGEGKLDFDPGELSVDDYPVALAPAFRFGYSAIQARIPRGQWRAVENSMNVFVIQSFLDEAAQAAGRDPLEYRLELVERATERLGRPSPYDPARMAGVLRLAAGRAGWGPPLPRGRGRGIACCFANHAHVAEVVEVELQGDRLRVVRVVAAVDAGCVVHPDGALAQVEGSILMGLSAALGEEITVAGGAVEQLNFDRYRLLRIGEAPRVEVHFVRGGDEPRGLGEPCLPPAAPALANAIFAASGRRLRELPLSRAGIVPAEG